MHTTKNIKKHGQTEKKGKNGTVISSSSFSDAEYQSMLQWAVHGTQGSKRYLLKEYQSGKLVVFFYENATDDSNRPLFHAFDVIDLAQLKTEKEKVTRQFGDKFWQMLETLSDVKRNYDSQH